MGGTGLDKFKAFNELYKQTIQNFEDPNNAYNLLLDKSIQDTTYYVDCINGNDSHNGLSINTALRTITKAVSMVPTFINHNYKIQLVSTGTYDACHIENKYGYLTISGNYASPNSYTLTSLDAIRWHNTKLNFYGVSIFIKQSPWDSIWMNNANVFMDGCGIYTNQNILAEFGSKIRIHNATITSNAYAFGIHNYSQLVLDYTISLTAKGGVSMSNFSTSNMMFFSGSSLRITPSSQWDNALRITSNSGVWFRDSFQQSKFEGSGSASYYVDQTSKITGNFEYLSVTATSNYTATLNKEMFINCNTSSGAITIKMPTGADTNRMYVVTDISGAASTNPISISGSGKLINGSPTASITASYMSKILTYSGSMWIMK